MSKYDFTRLTQAQQALLTFAGWEPGCGRLQPAVSTTRKLIERGLLVRRTRTDYYAGATFQVPIYDVPLDVHAAWCAHCARYHRPPKV